jgi:hypothetical protein
MKRAIERPEGSDPNVRSARSERLLTERVDRQRRVEIRPLQLRRSGDTRDIPVTRSPDAPALPYLLHGKETQVWGDQAHRGQSEAIREVAPQAQDFTNQRYRWGKGRSRPAIRSIKCAAVSTRAKYRPVTYPVLLGIFSA